MWIWKRAREDIWECSEEGKGEKNYVIILKYWKTKKHETERGKGSYKRNKEWKGWIQWRNFYAFMKFLNN